MKEKEKIELNYEMKMYQLLLLFIVTIFLALGIGVWVGHSLGFSAGIDAINVKTPDYCYAEGEGHQNISIVCNELQNITVSELCTYLSTPLEHKIKILITG